jgi:hypothetical protein
MRITLHPMPGQTTFRLPEDLLQALDRAARARGVPRSQLVREALQRYLAAPEAPRAPVSVQQRSAPYIGAVRLDPRVEGRDPTAALIRRHNWRD